MQGSSDMWGDTGTMNIPLLLSHKFHRQITLPSSHSRFQLKLQLGMTSASQEQNSIPCLSFYLKPPQFIVAAVPKVLN